MREGRPARIRPVEKLRADDHRGGTAEVFAGDGTMYLVGSFYAGDETEALAVCRRLEAMREPFGDSVELYLVGTSMAPDLDTPDVLRAFAEKHGFEGDEWIFITGNRERIRKYMNKEFRYPGRAMPEEERERPEQLYEGEPRITLVDGRSEIRGVYWVREDAKGEVKNDKLSERDIRFLLDNEIGEGSAKKSDD